MQLFEQARAVLQRHYGYPDFRGGQRPAIEAVLSGRDALILMPTGGGKSLCFQIPSQVLPGITIVVSPLISLMKDQVDALNQRGIPATFVNSTIKPKEIANRLEAVQSRAVKLLYIAPERFDSASFRDRIKQFEVSLLAVDEAHCVSQWGKDFRPSYARLGRVRRALRCPVLALTATATLEVRTDIIRMLALRKPEVIARGFDRPNLSWAVQHVDDDSEKDRVFTRLLHPGTHNGTAIGYASTRKRVEALSELLNSHSIRAVAYHAGMTPADRQRLQEGFITGTAGVVVATNAFGMGIDKPDVRRVVHYDHPGSLEAYYQEAGRAGRDGKPAECIILRGPEDHRTHEFLLDQAHPRSALVESAYGALAAMIGTRTEMITAEAVAGKVGGAVGPRQIDAAFGVLRRFGCVEVQKSRAGMPRLRLVALTPRVIDHARRDAPLAAELLTDLKRTQPDNTLYCGLDLSWAELRRFGETDELSDQLQQLAAARLIEWEPFRSASLFKLVHPPYKRDLQEVEAHRAREQSRLNRMRTYTTHTACRRAYLLRYFGEQPEQKDCASCDNCMDTSSKLKRVGRMVRRSWNQL
ncbi:MAG: ATP-dependent DNA helicase RecQ [Gemmatimonadota bacterium]